MVLENEASGLLVKEVDKNLWPRKADG